MYRINAAFGIFTLFPRTITGKPKSSGRCRAVKWIVYGFARNTGATWAHVSTAPGNASISSNVNGNNLPDVMGTEDERPRARVVNPRA